MLEALGLDPTAAVVYRLLLTGGPRPAADLARQLEVPEGDLRGALARLEDLALLAPAGPEDEMRPVNPAVGLRRLIDREKRELRGRQEAVEGCEADVAELTSAFNRSHSEYASYTVEQLIGVEAVRRRIEDLARSATSECLTFNPGGAQSAASLAASKPLDADVLGRGVGMRTVYLDSVRNAPATAAYAAWLHANGGEVRTVPSLPIRMVVVDRRTVITPLDPENTRAGGIQLSEPGVVAGLSDLFDRVWATATPLGAGPRRDDSGLTGQEQELLRLVGGGLTDEVAAKRLGLSPRTTRRMMADLMHRLGAQSRFQAGMLAAQRRWL